MSEGSLTFYRDGPIVVRGPVEVLGANLPEGVRDRPATALCRCGLSAMKPLCDGSHKAATFEAPGLDGAPSSHASLSG
jgi:CDGSH-type Zn-finger protein